MTMTTAAGGQVITFYSYKGGTGRSMALANVACLLARRAVVENAKPVLAIDWDLEAPGLHRYFEPLLVRRDAREPGLIDLLYDVRNKLPPTIADEEREALAKSLADGIDLDRYVEKTSFPKLSFLRAGRFDDQYGERVNTFSWTALYEAVPAFFRLFAQRLARHYSFVLVDSRTGVTDTSGICTRLMPEKLVVVFTPNRQSLTGITELVQRADAYRRSSRDPRPLTAFPLPSRIDTSFPDLMKLWRMGGGKVRGWQKEFIRVLKEVEDLDAEDAVRLERYFDAVQIVHVAQHAFGEPIAVLDERSSDKTTVTSSYAALRDYLLRGAPWLEEAAVTGGDESAKLRRKLVELEERIGTGSGGGDAAPEDRLERERARRHMVVFRSLMALALLLAFAVWPLWTWRKNTAASELLAELLRPEARLLEPGTYSLLLAQALPDLSTQQLQIAVARLKETLAVIPVMRRPAAETRTTYAQFSRSGRRLLLHDGETISIWDARLGSKIHEWRLIAQSVRFYGADEDKFISRSSDRLEMWSGDRRTASQHLSTEGLAELELTADGSELVEIRPTGVRIFSLAEAVAYRPATRATLPLDIAPDNIPRERTRFVEEGLVVGEDGVALFSPSKGPWVSIPMLRPDVAHLGADGRQLGIIHKARVDTYRSDRVLIMDVQSRDSIFEKFGAIYDFALSPSRDQVLTAGEALRLIEVPSGKVIAERHHLSTGEMRLYPVDDGRFLVRYRDQVAMFSESLEGPSFRVRTEAVGFAFSSALDRMAVVSSDAVAVYDITPLSLPADVAALQEATCTRVGRSLTREEWAAYYPDRQYDPLCAK
jgi:cellulose biosynthesis protein BcsQ